MSVLDSIAQAESRNQNIPNSSGASSAYGPFQITQGTWNQFGAQTGYPTVASAPVSVQAQVAGNIPLGRWQTYNNGSTGLPAGMGNMTPNQIDGGAYSGMGGSNAYSGSGSGGGSVLTQDPDGFVSGGQGDTSGQSTTNIGQTDGLGMPMSNSDATSMLPAQVATNPTAAQQAQAGPVTASSLLNGGSGNGIFGNSGNTQYGSTFQEWITRLAIIILAIGIIIVGLTSLHTGQDMTTVASNMAKGAVRRTKSAVKAGATVAA